jgi:hypothetical protein
MLRAAVALAALSLFAVTFGPGRAAEEKPVHVHRSAEMEKCLKACAECVSECESCFHHCVELTASGHKEHVKTLKTCVDCGDICATAAKIIARQGALSAQACEGWALACDACGAECEKFSADAHMKACAKTCKECAAACREMIKHVGHETVKE